MPLSDYYEAKGEPPGRWIGSGLTEVGSIEYGDLVTAEQGQHLFGHGRHPVAAADVSRDRSLLERGWHVMRAPPPALMPGRTR